MIFRYFADTDMLVIELMPGISTESQEVAPGVVIDFDAHDRAIGIEIEDASVIMDLSELRVLALPLAHLVVADRASHRGGVQYAQADVPVLAEQRETYHVTASRSVEDDLQRITSDPKVMLGKPVIKGTRLTVEHILNLLASGVTPDEIVAEYDGLSEQDIRACLRFAAQSLREHVAPHEE
jgi:uncharacterized protein (DUF433 family)/uncharacterized protein YuzE